MPTKIRTGTVARAALAIAASMLAIAACRGDAAPKHLAVDLGPAPWPTPDHIEDRVAAAHLPHSALEKLDIHYHAHLDIFVDGVSVPVAPSIGRVDQAFFSPLHTHAPSGMIHIEAAKDAPFTLAMLFTEWGVRLTDACVGGYCRPTTPIAAYIDGKVTAVALPTIRLVKGEEIAIVIGTPPAAIPSGWDCLANVTAENPAQCKDFNE